ncbi:hypothetical protein ACFL3V_00080 [Nanoarchaeota archaeon]
MKCVRVNVRKLEVESFSLKDGAELKLFFDDGSKKCLLYSAALANVEEDVKNIILKIHTYEKSENKVFDADDVLDSFVSVVIEHEEELLEKMRTFLGRLRDEKARLQNFGSHSGYIESLNKMQKKCIEFRKGVVRNE